MRWRKPTTYLPAALLVLAVGCGGPVSDEAGKPGGDFNNDGPGEPDDGATGGGNGGSGPGAGSSGGFDAGLPPEAEETVSFDLPQAGATAVYVPNPVTDRVAVVNADTFAIETVRAGKAPTYTATIPGQDVAIVLNVGTRDASLLRTAKGKTSTVSLPVGHDANAIAVAPDGKHAVIYLDARSADQRATSFQDVTVVTLEEGKDTARGVSVGFGPRAVQFSADGSTAFVITEDDISIIDLTLVDQGPAKARLVGIGNGGLSGPKVVDPAVTPDGKYAIARIEGKPTLLLIDLATGAIRGADLTALAEAPGDDGGTDNPLAKGTIEITDVDVAPDGSFAMAVAREQGALIRVPVPAGFSDLSLIEVIEVDSQLVGSVEIAKTGKLAVAYTSAAPIEGVVLVDLTGAKPQHGIRLRKSVRAVALSSDGTRALVLHAKKDGRADLPGLSEEERIDRSEGYSLIDTGSGFAKLQLTDAKVSSREIVVTPGTTQMYALLRDDSRLVRALQRADLGSFQVTTLPLVAPPSSIGLVPSSQRLFVGQELSGGMITFVDSESGEIIKAVTGFELTSRIRQ